MGLKNGTDLRPARVVRVKEAVAQIIFNQGCLLLKAVVQELCVISCLVEIGINVQYRFESGFRWSVPRDATLLPLPNVYQLVRHDQAVRQQRLVRPSWCMIRTENSLLKCTVL